MVLFALKKIDFQKKQKFGESVLLYRARIWKTDNKTVFCEWERPTKIKSEITWEEEYEAKKSKNKRQTFRDSDRLVIHRVW